MCKEGQSWRAALWFVVLASVSGCGGGGGGDSDPRTCTYGSDCAVACRVGSFILVGSDSTGSDGTCVPPCATADQCEAGFACAELATGVRGCIAACTTHDNAPSNFGCVDQVPVHCSLARPGDVPCDRCCDPLSTCRLCQGGEFCDLFDTGVCRALLDLGDPCYFQEECASGSCAGSTSDAPGVCQVAHGAPCDGSNCSRCITTGDTTFCHQECFGRLSCPEGFQNCLGSREDDRYWCHQDASGFSCPAGYEDHSYQEFNGSAFRVACIPLTSVFVCGAASVGPPCN